MMPSQSAAAPDRTLDLNSPEATGRLASALAERLRGGEIVLLRGGLGAGKTFFASALARALGVTRPVSSPTYVILCSYPARGGLALNHCDFYRFETEADLDTIDIDEHIGSDSVLLVEWPERCPNAFADVTLELRFVPTGEESRRVEIWRGGLPLDEEDWPPAQLS